MRTATMYTAENEQDEKTLAAIWNAGPKGFRIILTGESTNKKAKKRGFIRTHVKQIALEAIK